ncbi:MAG: DNA helicase [Sphingobium sp.]|nr:MAG: DNA helicase [Sphingobium sp.]
MTGQQRATSGPQSRSIQKLFDETRKRLVETGTRNRLVHVNRANTRGNVVNIINERSDDVYNILSSGRAMRFLGLGHDKAEAGEISLADEHEEIVGTDRFTDNQLETRLGPDALAKRLLKIAREAQTAEEEQGVNVLYLALGFVTWFEDKNSGVAREAPLVLLPVQLVRNQRTSSYDIRLRDDDLMTNLPLQQRWQDDFGILLPEIDDDAEGWRPSAYHQAVEEIIAARPNWRVDRNSMQLGFFSFSKLLMYRDLALEAWPQDALETHDLTRGLLYEGFEHEAPLFGRDDRLDDLLPPDKLFHVVNADASQAKVIEEVRVGRNLVVQGPPGTGKSQTITNIIAAAAQAGKTVLFVAEKMAALSVVHDRLLKVGLRDLILELHSKTANKKAVLGELARTLAAGQAVPTIPPPPAALLGVRDRLNALAEALHRPIGNSGETPYSVLGRQARYLGMGAPMPTLNSSLLATMSRADETTACEKINHYATLVKQAGAVENHPFAGVGALDFQPVGLARLKIDLENAASAVRALRGALDAAMTMAGLDGSRSQAMVSPITDILRGASGLNTADADLARRILASRDLQRLTEALEVAAGWQAARDEALSEFVDTAFAHDVAPLRAPVAAGTASFFARWGSAYREASRGLAGLIRGALPKAADDRLALIDRLGDVQAMRHIWADDEAFMSDGLGDFWRGERTDFARAARVARWAGNAAATSPNVAPDRLVAMGCASDRDKLLSDVTVASAPAGDAIADMIGKLALDARRLGDGPAASDLSIVADLFLQMVNATDRYAEWAALCEARKQLDAAGLGALASRVADGALDAHSATVELKFARAEKLWEAALAADVALKGLAQLDRHALVDEFARLERSRLGENVATVLAGHLAQLPQGAQGEMKIVRGEIGKRRAHMALRRLFLTASRAIQRIKPVLLMSPISVAQYLTPGQVEFDLLIIDEASQVRPEDALGAIARAKQIVVVGDEKQLPPSSFFDRLLADGGDEDSDAGDLDGDDEDETQDLLGGAASLSSSESILTLCEARGLPARMLQWHYRSRDPSLMRVSNAEFYKSELVLPPSPLEKDPNYGLVFTRVDGAYDRGGRRDNRIESEAIVRRVAEHAQDTPDLSLGIVTFSHAQKNTINELLELARRSDSALDGFLREGRAEDLFVKNIENVQGDERDVILISVGYGPTEPGGRMIGASFGPVNGDGGERRLNVLFTRARLRCEVFASFDPGDLDVSRAVRDGPRILKRFLDYAKSGAIDQPMITGELPDTPFEEDVADVVRSLGFLADPQVGSAGFRIDIGVRHPDQPGNYLLAIECDGATYHSALWARERDRLRQDVLEHLGWRFHRIWSTDWFYDRRKQVERLRAALEAARSASGATISINGGNSGKSESDVVPHVGTAFEIPESFAREMPAYLRARPWTASTAEPHEAPLTMLIPLVVEIVGVEGPVHIDEVARRIAAAFGKQKAGRRVLEATRQALMAAKRQAADLRTDEQFWFTAAQATEPPVRDRSAEEPATCKAHALSMLEIRAALRLAREDNPGGSGEDLVRTAARLMGFRRVGADLHARFTSALD